MILTEPTPQKQRGNMRTITTTVYTFEELTEDAKEQALQHWNENGAQEYFWGEDALNSLKAGIEHFNCTLSNYSIDFLESNRSSVKIDTPYHEPDEDELDELIESSGSYNPETFKGLGDCKLTGYCMDEDFLDGVRIAYKNGETDLEELMMEGYSQWHEAVTRDYEYHFTMEFFADHAEANEMEFEEDGTII